MAGSAVGGSRTSSSRWRSVGLAAAVIIILIMAAWMTTPTAVTVPHPWDWARCFEQISLPKSPEADKKIDWTLVRQKPLELPISETEVEVPLLSASLPAAAMVQLDRGATPQGIEGRWEHVDSRPTLIRRRISVPA